MGKGMIILMMPMWSGLPGREIHSALSQGSQSFLPMELEEANGSMKEKE